jgi:two-component system, OmpR family, phosphate regulon sensor histidine kinase PhoR
MRSIRTKITLTYVLVSLSVLVVFGALLDYEFATDLRDRMVSQLKTETSVVYAVVREGGKAGRPRSEVAAILREISAAAKIRITLITSDGAVIFESDVADSALSTLQNHGQRPEVVQARELGIGDNIRYSATLGIDMVYVARTVDPAAFDETSFRDLRFIRTAMPYVEIQSMIADNRIKIVLLGLGVFLAIVLASRIIARRITTPILELSATLREIKSGNLDRLIPVRTADEMGDLAETINEMTAKLKSDIEQLKKLERFRSEFLGNVSHELRTPIFSLKGFLETLLDGAIDDPAVSRTFVEKAYHHASRLDTLLTDLIEISRLESGELAMSLRYFEVEPFLRSVAADFADAAGRKNQTIILQVPEGGTSAFGDKDRLRHAVDNIVDNAIKYTGEGSTITLRVSLSDGKVRFEIEDNGPGIPQEHLPRIFERFYRIDKNRSRELGGTGLGLAIAKHIIDAHGSKIEVSSEIGRGTTFSFWLKQ